jgi:hypothetical protein
LALVRFEFEGTFICAVKIAHGKKTKQEVIAYSIQKTEQEFKKRVNNRSVMATAKEIKKHLDIALQEIGVIKPWYNRKFKNWIYHNPSYPVEYTGNSKEEAIKNYPLYLREFIKERLNNNLNPLTEQETKGRGGKREGAGRPLGSIKEVKMRVYLPKDVAVWIKHPEAITQIRQLMCKHK